MDNAYGNFNSILLQLLRSSQFFLRLTSGGGSLIRISDDPSIANYKVPMGSGVSSGSLFTVPSVFGAPLVINRMPHICGAAMEVPLIDVYPPFLYVE